MKYVHLVFLITLCNNVLFSMEMDFAPRNKVWRVDKEIQCEKLPTSYCGKEYSFKDWLRFINFSKNGKEIIAWNRGFPLCFVWDRNSGILLERVEEADRSNPVFQKPEWKDRIPESHFPKEYPEKWGKDFNDYDLEEESETLVLAIKNKEYQVCVWDKIEKKETLQLVHENRVNRAHFNRKGIEIVTASQDGTMRLWHSQTGQELLRMNHASNVTDAEFNEIGTEIVVAREDGKIQILVQEVK